MAMIETFSQLNMDMKKYQDTHFGIKNGADFSEFATQLSTTETFKELVAMATTMGLLAMLTISKKDNGEENAKEQMKEMFEGKGPLASTVADILYLGYRLGMAVSETKQLEQLATR